MDDKMRFEELAQREKELFHAARKLSEEEERELDEISREMNMIVGEV